MTVESVWDYPRPPAVEPVAQRLRVLFADTVIADTTSGLRVLETSHPPAYYFPPDAVRTDLLVASQRRTVCEFKGRAHYWTVAAGGRTAEDAVWCYPRPAVGYEALTDHYAFYAGLMGACFVGDELVRAQEGDFYGGWVTSALSGPFKGGEGTTGW